MQSTTITITGSIDVAFLQTVINQLKGVECSTINIINVDSTGNEPQYCQTAYQAAQTKVLAGMYPTMQALIDDNPFLTQSELNQFELDFFTNTSQAL
jgi:translation elongation factor EF-4